ncbi:MAG: sulfite exporter TauE/SafE family protein [Gammaproteobacteria bacterium]|nr:sulfite exporter TauE/SafE family protein [Gammaproteobacteria bacterium]MCY4337937.1 sulfite exporter TauE/SafE family protein [Gammaproteobacteria bacterium]
MEIWQYLILLLVGIVVGFVNVMAGGGSLLSIPVMLFMGVPAPVANGTNRIAILAQMATGTIAFFRQGYSDFKLSLTLALAAVPGAVVGALIGARLEGVWFNRILAVIMLAVMLVMATEKRTPDYTRAPPPRPRLALAHALMALVGIWGGFIQVGAGFLFMPILYKTLGLDLVRVNMHKTFIITVYTTAALIVFAWQVELFWALGLSLAVGTSIGAWLSAQVQVSQGERLIKVVLNTVLALFIVKLLFFK